MNVSYSDNTDCTVKLRFSKNLNLQWVRFKYEIVIKHKLYFQNTKTNFWLNNLYMCDQESIHIYKWNLRGWSTSPPQILNKKIKKNLCTKNFNISAQKSSVAPSLRWLMTIWEADVRRFVCCESGSSLAPTGALKSKDEMDECDKSDK